MNGHPYYMRYVKEALLERGDLTLESRGAFDLIFDHMVHRGGPLACDDKLWARKANTTPYKWRKACETLLFYGLIVIDNGRIVAPSAMETIKKVSETRRKHSENGAKGGRISAETRSNPKHFNKLDQAGLEDRARGPISNNQYPVTSNREDERNKVEISYITEPDVWNECERIIGRNLPRHSGHWWVDRSVYVTALASLEIGAS